MGTRNTAKRVAWHGEAVEGPGRWLLTLPWMDPLGCPCAPFPAPACGHTSAFSTGAEFCQGTLTSGMIPCTHAAPTPVGCQHKARNPTPPPQLREHQLSGHFKKIKGLKRKRAITPSRGLCHSCETTFTMGSYIPTLL